VLFVPAVAVAAATAATAIRLVPATRSVTIANAVVFPVARVVNHAAHTAAVVTGADVSSATALAAAEILHLTHAHVVPLRIAAVSIICTHACLNAGISAPRSVLRLATVPAAALAAVLGTRSAVLAIFTSTVAAPAAATAIPASKLFHFVHADVVPRVVAAEVILCADAVLYRCISAPRTVLWLAAVTAATLAAILGAGTAIFAIVTVPVATAARTAAVGIVPTARAVAIADAVVFPVAGVIHHAAGAIAPVPGADIPAAAAIAAPELLNLVGAHVVPLGCAAVVVLGADAILNA